MIAYMVAVRRHVKDDQGASAVEYGLLIAAIAAVIVVIVFALGSVVKSKFHNTCTMVIDRRNRENSQHLHALAASQSTGDTGPAAHAHRPVWFDAVLVGVIAFAIFAATAQYHDPLNNDTHATAVAAWQLAHHGNATLTAFHGHLPWLYTSRRP